MSRAATKYCGVVCFLLVAGVADLQAQKPPYDVFPPAEPPYYRVRYEASDKPGELILRGQLHDLDSAGREDAARRHRPPARLRRGVVQVGADGCVRPPLAGAGEEARLRACCRPSYEQPEKADCQMWCDPRNGSDAAFQKCLADLGAKSGHPELAKVPWALWGHSGGGHWAGGMVLLHPDRVAAAWLRSGVPLLKADPARKGSRRTHCRTPRSRCR